MTPISQIDKHLKKNLKTGKNPAKELGKLISAKRHLYVNIGAYLLISVIEGILSSISGFTDVKGRCLQQSFGNHLNRAFDHRHSHCLRYWWRRHRRNPASQNFAAKNRQRSAYSIYALALRNDFHARYRHHHDRHRIKRHHRWHQGAAQPVRTHRSSADCFAWCRNCKHHHGFNLDLQ